MCYSARIIQDYRQYVRSFGAQLGIKEFVDLFWRRRSDPKIKIPKAMEGAFAELQGDEGNQIRAMIEEFKARSATELEQRLFAQRTRLVDAERALLTKTTKALTESQRIASDKIDDARAKLADLQRTELRDDDSRIFPGHYAPVMVMEGGKRVVKPMRYQVQVRAAAAALCVDARPCGQPVHAMPPYLEGASQTRGTHPGFCCLGKGELRASSTLKDELGSDASHRDVHVHTVAALGRLGWQEATGYGKRALIETTMGRYKAIIGPLLRARNDAGRCAEAAVGAVVLNRMLAADRPNSVRATVNVT